MSSTCARCGLLIDQPTGGRPLVPLSERFRARVNELGPIPEHVPHIGRCHVWTGAVNKRNGYAYITLGGKYSKNCRAHRVAFFLAHGRWPSGAVLHRCDNRLCMRPSHLQEGTVAENNRDMIAKGRNSHGERQWLAKLRQSDIPAIRSEYASGISLTVLAKKYGVSRATIHSAATGRTWVHVGEQ